MNEAMFKEYLAKIGKVNVGSKNKSCGEINHAC